MSTTQANIDKHRQERWEDFLDTVFARGKKIKEIRISKATLAELAKYLVDTQYSHQIIDRLDSGEAGYLWHTPVVIDETCSWAKIVYAEGILSPEPNPKIKKEKPVDTWLDDEV